VALAECLRGDGEILVSPIGTLPTIGARLARLAFEPDLLLTDGAAYLRADTPALGTAPGDGDAAVVEGWMPYRSVFDTLWSGRRHVLMGASQIDAFGNQNISCIGPFERPKAMLLGPRGAPGNTLNHVTSYWIPRHDRRVFVERVDVVTGVGYDRAARLGRAARFHEIRRVVSGLGVFDFGEPGQPGAERRMRLVSVHPGVSVDEVVESTGFPLVIPQRVPETRAPTAAELRLLRERIDPEGLGARELAA
jgi:acyl CoA:acetate/3-ketoacid CoA transferase beta subunit